MKLQSKIALIVLLCTIVAIFAVNFLLKSTLREKDLAEAKRVARQTSLLVKAALLNTMISTGDYDRIAAVIADMQKSQNFRFRMVRSTHVIKQHGIKRDEVPKTELEREALKSAKVIEVQDSPTTLRIIYPFVTDERCAQCHLDMNDKPVKPGVVNGLAVIMFDLSEQQNRSEKVVNQMVASLTVVMLVSALFVLFMVYTTVTQPMENIAEALTGFRKERFDINMPAYSTYEIKIMADEVKTTAEKLAEHKRQREEAIEEERTRYKEIQKVVRSRTEALGLDYDAELGQIVKKMSLAIDGAKKADLMGQIFKYVVHGESKLVFPSDPSLIPAVSVYLGQLIESTSETVKKRSIELALDEALSNAILHGNLEISSDLKEEDFDMFYEMAMERAKQEPYSSRNVAVTYEFDREMARFTIEDEGPGFKWQAYGGSADSDKPFGRGLMILKALSSKIEFNERGNRVSLSFDLTGANETLSSKTA